jgi:exodeoxyribonuclease VII large subunit
MGETPAAAPPLDHNRPALSVSELSQALKRMVETEFDHVRVRGEISGFKRHTSGHLYFTLKDEDAVLDAVCWKQMAPRLGLKPEDGMDVIATGRLTTYPGRSKYQVVVERMELAGAGALLKLLEERKAKLAAEGLFDAARKRALPFLPTVIGVVTSPTGAVIRDILHRLDERFPRRVLVWPVAVQGEGAAEQVAAAIEGFNALKPGGAVPRPDLIIVARGGGSLEDLWAFNEEIVVRAAAGSRIPLISAVGHETDTTLIDFASDKRAPTPTAAAEMAVPVRAELIAKILDLGRRSIGGMQRALDERRQRVAAAAGGLPDLPMLLGHAAQRLDDWSGRLSAALLGWLRVREQHFARAAAGLRRSVLEQPIARGLERTQELAQRLPGLVKRRIADAAQRLSAAAQMLQSLSYERVLDRGYALVRDAAGEPVTSAAGAKPGADIAIRFKDGDVGARVTGAAAAPVRPAAPRPAAPRPAQKRKRSDDDDQGTLL